MNIAFFNENISKCVMAVEDNYLIIIGKVTANILATKDVWDWKYPSNTNAFREKLILNLIKLESLSEILLRYIIINWALLLKVCWCCVLDFSWGNALYTYLLTSEWEPKANRSKKRNKNPIQYMDEFFLKSVPSMSMGEGSRKNKPKQQ